MTKDPVFSLITALARMSGIRPSAAALAPRYDLKLNTKIDLQLGKRMGDPAFFVNLRLAVEQLHLRHGTLKKSNLRWLPELTILKYKVAAMKSD